MPADTESNDLKALWREVEKALRSSVPASTYDLWLAGIEPVGAKGSTLFLAAPATTRTWVERRYSATIRRAVAGLRPDLTRVEIAEKGSGTRSRGRRGATEKSATQAEPNPAHDFSRFVIGPGNRFAHAAALAVAEMPGEAYNPLFIHGAPGLGKSHLLGSISRYVAARHPDLRTRATTAEEFTGEFVQALRTHGADSFKGRYREIDLLLIDDVQFLEGKERTEEEFFHTFNTLYESGSQIVLSSDRPPGALSRLAERLRDRFDWGLTVEVTPPDILTRLTLMRRLAAEAGLTLDGEEALREIAVRAPANLRKLEGAFTRVVAYASTMRTPITADLVRELIADAPAGGGARPDLARTPGQPTLEAIERAVCDVVHLSPDELRSNRRQPELVLGRQIAIHIARKATSHSLAELATWFGRDRATIVHSVRTIDSRLASDRHVHRAVEEALRLVGENPERIGSG